MRNQIKHFFNGFYSLNKSEQKGIVILVILILLLFTLNQFLPLFINSHKTDQSIFLKKVEDFRRVQQKIADSIQIEKLQNSGKLSFAQASQKLMPFPFNPNGLSEKDWLTIGLTKKQIATIKNYETKGGRFYSKEDLKKIYGISKVEYQILDPFIVIPLSKNTKPHSQKSKKNKKVTQAKKVLYHSVEINEADSTILVNSLRLPPWIAKRIIKYRNLLGGFYSKNQLYDVYGLDSIEITKRMNFIKIDSNAIQKLNINSLSFKELLKHPYISYDLTTWIVNTRLEKGNFESTKELLNSPYITDSLYSKLKKYVVIE